MSCDHCLRTSTRNYFVLYYFCTLQYLPWGIGLSCTTLGWGLCLSRSARAESLFTYGAFSKTQLMRLNAEAANCYLYYFHCCYLYAIDYLLSRWCPWETLRQCGDLSWSNFIVFFWYCCGIPGLHPSSFKQRRNISRCSSKRLLTVLSPWKDSWNWNQSLHLLGSRGVTFV